MSGPLTTADLVDMGDLDALLIRIDHFCADHEWAAVLDLRDRCRRAIERGRQLWPAASHAEYRLALEAPGPMAATVLVPGTGRFALGPLAEVAASTHTWAELAPHLQPTPEAGMIAHERVVRGEDLASAASEIPLALELPLRLQHWEPAYPLPTYRAHTLEVAEPPPPDLHPIGLHGPGKPVDDPEAVRALVDLAQAWKQESNGAAEAVAVDGDGPSAVAALPAAVDGVRMAEVAAAHALAVMAGTAASGGAHGRRRGLAAGRFGAWWAVAALAGLLDEWPFDADDVGEAAADLRWYRWDPAAPPPGWSLRLAVEDPDTGRAWAVEATDHT